MIIEIYSSSLMAYSDDYDNDYVEYDPYDNAAFDEEDFFERESWENEEREYDPGAYWDESEEHYGDY
ncbi:hypothetical protein D3C76_466550 [compost metagenome]